MGPLGWTIPHPVFHPTDVDRLRIFYYVLPCGTTYIGLCGLRQGELKVWREVGWEDCEHMFGMCFDL